jgi:TetR/AcrR family transcriptional regulator, transcriptional repressor for nem operon
MASRDPVSTRKAILEAAFVEIHRHGFQAASIANIVKKAGLTKGACFHYFPNKLALGYAVVDDVIATMIREQWVTPLQHSKDPLKTITDSFAAGIDALACLPDNLGCPLNNLAQEMSALDEGFRRRTQQIFDLWVSTFARAIDDGRALGCVDAHVNAQEVALFLVSQIEGILSLSKNAQDLSLLRTGLHAMKTYFASLRPTNWIQPLN